MAPLRNIAGLDGVRLSSEGAVRYTGGDMKSESEHALLPEGLHDGLPPAAGHETRTVGRLLAWFDRYGYEQVKPPLVEFEESLLSGPAAGMSRHMFRLMDPISQRMMGVRADITTQVARIAISRLEGAPRPLRLCYAGQVLRVRGSQLRPERQFTQAGVELIGGDSDAADAEAVLLAAEALGDIGVAGLSVDLTAPSLVPLMAADMALDEELAEDLRTALDGRDGAALAALPEAVRERFQPLAAIGGPADEALATLDDLSLPASVRELVERLRAVIAAVRAAAPDLTLTLDPGESRGFEYQTGVSFTLFAKGVRGELGRGGRYRIDGGDSATGFTLYLDSVMRALPGPMAVQAVYLPFGGSPAQGAQLRAKGWRTLQGLQSEADTEAEARRLGCSHILKDGAPAELN